jgi:hypothetical protein
MSSWSISAEGVVQVLTAVQTSAENLGASLDTLETNLTSAITASQSQAIADAVQAWMSTETPGLTKVSERITAAMTGASEATQAYVDGDLQMAADSQSYQVTAATRGQNWDVNKGMF